MAEYDEDELRYVVVVNHEEQYSIWPEDREIPDGWRPDGFAGDRAACLDHVAAVWTDMRPLSLRQWLADPPAATEPDPLADDDGPDLVDRLTTGTHPVELVTAPGRETLASALADGLVFLRFPDTRGPAELAVSVPEPPESQPAESGPDAGTDPGSPDSAGEITEFAGSLCLDWVDLDLSARIDPGTLAGTATLTRAAAQQAAGGA